MGGACGAQEFPCSRRPDGVPARARDESLTTSAWRPGMGAIAPSAWTEPRQDERVTTMETQPRSGCSKRATDRSPIRPRLQPAVVISACIRSRWWVPNPMERIRVGLVADPAAPTEIAQGMTDLSPLDGSEAWDITVVSKPFTTGSEDVETAVGRLQDQARQRNWDLVVGLTELPLHDHEGRHLLVETDPERRTAVLSLPALGGLRMHARARRAVRSLVSGMADPNAEDEHRVALPRVRGRWRLLLGMVLANRPWLLVPGLKSALVAALATGAVATINSTVWLLAGSLSWWRLVVATIASVALVVAWLVIDGELWDRPDDDSPQARERSRLYNASTLVTLLAGVLICYVALYVVNLAWAFFVLDPAVMGSYLHASARLRRPVRPRLVRRVSSNRRRWPRLRPGVGRGDPRRRLLQARGGPARAPRARPGPPSVRGDPGRLASRDQRVSGAVSRRASRRRVPG